MGPFAQLMRATLNDDTDKYIKTLEILIIVLNGEEKQLIGKPLRKRSTQIGSVPLTDHSVGTCNK